MTNDKWAERAAAPLSCQIPFCVITIMETETDFIVYPAGSVWQFEPVSDCAKNLAQNKMGLEDWQWMGNRFCVDHRPAQALAQQLSKEGFVVEVES